MCDTLIVALDTDSVFAAAAVEAATNNLPFQLVIFNNWKSEYLFAS